MGDDHREEGLTAPMNSSPSEVDVHGSQPGRRWTGLSAIFRSPLSFGVGALHYTPVGQPDEGDAPAADFQLKDVARDVKRTMLNSKILSPSAPTESTYSCASSQDSSSIKGDIEDEEIYTQARTAVPNSPADFTRNKSIRQRILEKIQQRFSPRTRREKSQRRGTHQLEEGLLLKVAADSSADDQNPLKRVKSKLGSVDLAVMVVQSRTFPLRQQKFGHLEGHMFRFIGLRDGRSKELILSIDVVQSVLVSWMEISTRSYRRGEPECPGLTVRKHRQPSPPYREGLSTPLRRTYSDAQILPSSPPLLESPQLHSSLFFGSSRNATPSSAGTSNIGV